MIRSHKGQYDDDFVNLLNCPRISAKIYLKDMYDDVYIEIGDKKEKEY
jgi:hypothetical protein